MPDPTEGKPVVNPTEKYKPLTANNDILDISKNLGTLAEDKNAPFKTMTASFADLDRYKSHHLYNKLGYSPFRDNESMYNKDSNGLWEMTRAASWFGNVAWEGVKSGASSWGDVLSGNPLRPDLAGAQRFEHALSSGTSSRGGAASFVGNQFLNFGYTAGIIAEMFAEDLALGVITGGGAAPMLVAKNAWQVNRLRNVGKAVAKTVDAFKNLQNVNAARKFWEGAKSAGKALNPLSQTTEYLTGLNTAKKANNLEGFAQNSSVFGAFYRDLREINLAMAESKLEGGMVYNEMEEKLVNQYREENNGAFPPAEEYQRIASTARQASQSVTNGNIPAIYLTNKLTFGNMFKGIKPIAALEREFVDSVGNKIVKEAGKKVSPFKIAETGLKAGVKNILKPRTWLKGGITYFKENLGEGLQESVQEVISGAYKDYYTELYNHPGTQVKHNLAQNFADNIGNQFSAQGLETFGGGFFMGFFTKGGKKLYSLGEEAFNKQFRPEHYKEHYQERRQRLQNTVDTLNAVYNDPLKYFDPGVTAAAAQAMAADGMQEASESGDKKAFHDYKDHATFEHLMTTLQTGHFDSFVEHLQSIKEMNPEEIKEAYGREGKEVIGQIDQLVERAGKMKERYEYINSRFKNPYHPEWYKKDSDEYKREAIAWSSFEGAKKSAIFYQDAFDRGLERMNSLLNDFSTDPRLTKVGSSDLTLLTDLNRIDSELQMLQNEVATLEGSTDPMVKKMIKAKKAKLEKLEKYVESFSNWYEAPNEDDAKTEEERDEFYFKKMALYQEWANQYGQYVKHLGSIKGEFVSPTAIEDTFELLKDYYIVKSDAAKMSSVVELLHDPGAFKKHVERIQKIQQDIWDRRKTDIEKGQKAMADKKDTNDLINTLIDKNIVIKEEDLDAFLTTGVYPQEYFDTKAKEVVSIDTNPGKMLALWDILKDFEAAKTGEKKETPSPAEVKTEVKTEEPKKEQTPEGEVKKAEAKDITNSTPWDELPADLQEQLAPHFDRFLKAKEEKEKETEGPSWTIELSRVAGIRQTWLKQNPEARRIINAYKIAKEMKPEPSIANVPKLKTTSGNLDLMTIQDLKNLLKVLNERQDIARTGNESEESIKERAADILTLENYINFREGLSLPKSEGERLKVILEQIRAMQAGISKTPDEKFYLINGEPYKRVTSVITPIEKEMTGKSDFKYVKMDVVWEVYDRTIAIGKGVNEFMEMFKAKGLPEFNQRKYDLLEKAMLEEASQNNLEATVNDLAYDDSRLAGTTVDGVVRDFFINNGNIGAEHKPVGMSEAAFTDLVIELRRMQAEFSKMGLHPITEKMIIFDPVNKIAGEMDMLLVDDAGNVFVFDVKTSRKKRWAAYNDPKNMSSDKIKHSLQLSVYSNILHNNYGIEVKGIGVIPFEIDYDRDGNVTSVKHATNVVAPKKEKKAGRVVYASPGTGKTALVKSDNNDGSFVDGDDILFEFLKRKGIPHGVKSDASMDFETYLLDHPEEEVQLLKEIKKLYNESKKKGNTVLTSSLFAADIADEHYVTGDVGRMAAVYEKRGFPKEVAELQAKRVVEEEQKFESAKPIGEKSFIADVLAPSPVIVNLEYQPEVESAIPRKGEEKSEDPRQKFYDAIKLERRTVMGEEQEYYVTTVPDPENPNSFIGGFTKADAIENLNKYWDKHGFSTPVTETRSVEDRRKKSIEEIGRSRQGSMGAYVGYYEDSSGKERSVYRDTPEELVSYLNKLYDEEVQAGTPKPLEPEKKETSTKKTIHQLAEEVGFTDLTEGKTPKRGWDYFYLNGKDGLTRVSGKAIKIPGYEEFDFFIYPDPTGNYIAVHTRSGMAIRTLGDTQKNAPNELKEFLDQQPTARKVFTELSNPLTQLYEKLEEKEKPASKLKALEFKFQNNLQLVSDGVKTATSRSTNQAGLEVGKSMIQKVNGKRVKVTYHGELTVDQANEALIEAAKKRMDSDSGAPIDLATKSNFEIAEAFDATTTKTPMDPNVPGYMNGQGKRHIYSLELLDKPEKRESGKMTHKQVQEVLDNAKTLTELDAAVVELRKAYSRDNIGISPNLIKQMVADRRAALSEKVDVKDLKKGSVLIAKDTNLGPVTERLMVVDSVMEDGSVAVTKAGSDDVSFILAYELGDYMRYDEKMTNIPQAPAVTTAEREIAQKVKTENAEFTADAATLQKIADEAEKKSTAEVDKDFFDNLGCE